MIDFNLFLIPFLVVGIGNFFLSWLFYSPAVPWFKAWQIGVGIDTPKTKMTPEDLKAVPRLMGGAVVATFLFSYGLQVIIHSIGVHSFISGALIGLVIWAGFAVTHSLNTQFEGRKPVVLIINNVLYLFTYAAFGGLVAVWQ